jgi:hypothetical protein
MPLCRFAVVGPRSSRVHGSGSPRRLLCRTRQRCAPDREPNTVAIQQPVQGDSFLGSSIIARASVQAVARMRRGIVMLRARATGLEQVLRRARFGELT